MNKILSKIFFKQDTLKVAEELIGKFLVRKIGKKEIAVMITETEAYDGPYDLASHASTGVTPRNAIMFDHGGYFYIYLCYGMYNMLNVVTGDKDYPAAVLIRGVKVLPLSKGELERTNSTTMRGVKVLPLSKGELEGVNSARSNLKLDGPGKLTKYLQVDRKFDRKEIVKETGLWIEDRGVKVDEKEIKKTARVGVDYAGPVWRKKPYRFILTKS